MFANPVFITPGRSIFKCMFLLIFSCKTAYVSRTVWGQRVHFSNSDSNSELVFDWLHQVHYVCFWTSYRAQNNFQTVSGLTVGWPTTWLSNWWTGWLSCCLADWLAGWLADLLSDWLADLPTDWHNDWLTDRLFDWLPDCLQLTDWMADLLNTCLID